MMGWLFDERKTAEIRDRDDRVLDAIITWAYSLPDDRVEIDVSRDCLTVTPHRPGTAGFQVFPEWDTEFHLSLAGRQLYPRFDRDLGVRIFQAIGEGRCRRHFLKCWIFEGVRTEFLDHDGEPFYTYHENCLPWGAWRITRTERFEAYQGA